jgi:acetyl esterase/lipase
MNKLFHFFIIFLFPALLVAQENKNVIYLWPNGAPGFESRKNEREEAKDWWVKNIHNPSLTVYLPSKEKANGAAVVICPGGGHRENVFYPEGKEAAEYFNSIGVTAFVLKYRLFREEGSIYTPEHAKQDVFRAIRLIKSKAKELNIDTSRLGIMGFSAGGEVSGWLSYHFTDKNYAANDAIDLISAKPVFQILIYPGPLAVPDSVQKNAPPTFLLAANDDPCCSEPIVKLLQLHRKANVPVEVHLYAKGAHAFNMGNRSKLKTLSTWPQRLADWLLDNDYFKQ